jgi:hypothetical protein
MRSQAMNTAPLRRGFLFVPGFFVRPRETVSSSRPATLAVPRATAGIKIDRRPPPAAARSGLDGGEHGATLRREGRTAFQEKMERAHPMSLQPRCAPDRLRSPTSRCQIGATNGRTET